VRETVEEVMKIQKKKAEDQGIEFISNFINIAKDQNLVNSELETPVIFSDEDRIKQVLLGLQSNALKFTQHGKV
jgi:signal transduction histidine kinase